MLTVPSLPPSPRPRTQRSPPLVMLPPRPLPPMLSSLTPPLLRSRRLPLTLLEDTLHLRSMNTMTKLLTEALLPTLEDSRNVP